MFGFAVKEAYDASVCTMAHLNRTGAKLMVKYGEGRDEFVLGSLLFPIWFRVSWSH